MIFSTIKRRLLAGMCSVHSVQSGTAENEKLFYHLRNWKAFSSLNKSYSLFSFNSCIYFDLPFANEYIILLLPIGNLSFALTSFKTYLIVFVIICSSFMRGKINYLSTLGSLNAVLLVLRAGRFQLLPLYLLLSQVSLSTSPPPSVCEERRHRFKTSCFMIRLPQSFQDDF